MKDTPEGPLKKARLVARGFMQPKLEEEEVYAPVARLPTLRILLCLAVEVESEIHHLDVKSAFLNGVLKVPVYLSVPCGVSVPDNHVCKLVKSLYGLRESPKCWYERLNNFLIGSNLKKSSVDPCLYFSNTLFLLIWVDDIIIVSKCPDDVKNIKLKLATEFKMNDLTRKDHLVFLGLKILKENNRIYIHQKDFVSKILKRFNMFDCKELSLPMPPKLNLKKCDTHEFKYPYKELVGSLMYLMLGSRPDICFAISYLSQFQNCYGKEHWKYLKQVLNYLKGTLDFGIVFTQSNKEELHLNAFVDASFAYDYDRKSTSGYLLKLNNNVILWSSKKQSVVALSSTESEYIALSLCARECLFCKNLLSDIKVIKSL